jgi:hypothetical protein
MKNFEHIEPDDGPLKKYIGGDAGHTVPEGYFEELHTSIWLQINNSTSEINVELPDTLGQALPPSYFDELKEKIFSKIDHEAVAQLGSAIPVAQNPFLVPTSYFESSQKIILAQVQKPKVQFIKPWMRYSALAASVLLILGLSWLFLTPENETHTSQMAGVAATEEHPVQDNNYLSDLSGDEAEQALKNEDISEELIIQLADMSEPAKSISQKPLIQEPQVKEDQEDKDIEKYLMDHTDDNLIDEL